MTDDADPDRPARPAEPVRVARFDLADQPGPAPSSDGASVVGPGADGETTPRVARLDGLGSSTVERTRVADFRALDADSGRPLAPVIRLDAVGSRRGRPARRSPDDSAPPRTPGSSVDDDTSPRARGSNAGPRRFRAARRPVEAERPEHGDATDADATHEQAADGIPPDRPLPRGRRRRARAGRPGPDAPDPELPVPEADPVAIAREVCLRLLTDRARTRVELAHALTRKGVPAEAAAMVLDRFAEVGLIDDAAFAGQWVRSRHTHRGLGRRAIAVELRRKGVADGVAKEALAEVDAESEDRRARELIDRKLRSMAVDTAERRATAARRLVGMLARKGYGAGTAYRAVREALAEHGAEVGELDGDDIDG